jgi:fructose-specific PTS system IIB-like component
MRMKLVAVTACPTGIAHTYMAAAKLEKAAEKFGYAIKVETQGAIGIENKLSQAEVDNADAVIFATDIAIKQERRFWNARKIHVPVLSALKNPEAVFELLNRPDGGGSTPAHCPNNL